MMKNILFLIFFFTSLSVVAQTLPVTPGVISRSTSPVEDRYIYARQHLGIPRYADTTQANIYNGIDTCGALIFTYNTNSLYFRQCSPKKWIQLVSNTPPNINDSLSYYWPTIPRYFSQFGPTVKRSIGSASEDGLYIVTGGVDQMVIRPPATGGLGRVSGSVYKVLMIDTIDRWVGWGDGWVGAGGGLNEIYAGYGLTKIDDSTLAFSTTLRDSLITLINLRLLKSDTAFMLANYIRVSRFNDSLNRHWNAIIGKQLQLNGTGFVRATGTTISYDNSTYLTSVDTSNISNFFSKVRSLFSGTYPIQYLNGNFNLDTGATGWKSIGFNDLRYTPISGSANYIQNQYIAAQTADFFLRGDMKLKSASGDSMYYKDRVLYVNRTDYLIGADAISVNGGIYSAGPKGIYHTDGGGYYWEITSAGVEGLLLSQQGVDILKASGNAVQGFKFLRKGSFNDTLTITNMGITDSSARAASTKFVKDLLTYNQWYINSRADSAGYAAMSEPLAGNNLVLNNLAIQSGSTYATYTHGYKNTLFNLDTFHFVTLTQLIDSLATVSGSQNLQSVTGIGASTTNDFYLDAGGGDFAKLRNNGGDAEFQLFKTGGGSIEIGGSNGRTVTVKNSGGSAGNLDLNVNLLAIQGHTEMSANKEFRFYNNAGTLSDWGILEIISDKLTAAVNYVEGWRITSTGGFELPNITNLTTQDRLLGVLNSSGAVGNITLGSGLSLATGVLSTTGGNTRLDQILGATSSSSINNANNHNVLQWNTLSSGVGLKLESSSTAASSNTQTLFNVLLYGANAGSSQTTYAAEISNQHTGTSANNIAANIFSSGSSNASNTGANISATGSSTTLNTGVFASASNGTTSIAIKGQATGATTNIAAWFNRGRVQFGTVGTESALLELNGSTSGTVSIQPAAAAGTYTLTLPTTDGNANEFLQTNGSGVLTWAAGFTQSTYTPTLTNTTNIAASTAYTTHYIRIGDWVNVWGTVDIDATAATTITEMGMSLPESSTVGQIYDVAGTASFEDNTSVQIKGDVANGRAVWRFTPQSASNNKYSFHFSFKYVPA